jgi:hypothetical protein
MQEALMQNDNLNAFTSFRQKWNGEGISVSQKVFPKSEIHLCRHYKRWTKSRAARDSEISSRSHVIINALQHVPDADEGNQIQNFDIKALSVKPPTEFADEHAESSSPALMLQNGEISNASQMIMPRVNQSTQASLKRRCCAVEIDGQRCSNPLTCPGSQQRELCELYTARATRISADSIKKKRKYPSHRAQPKCSICNKTTCTVGVRNKKMCPQFVAELNDEQH